jgi:hypothetical protein
MPLYMAHSPSCTRRSSLSSLFILFTQITALKRCWFYGSIRFFDCLQLQSSRLNPWSKMGGFHGLVVWQACVARCRGAEAFRQGVYICLFRFNVSFKLEDTIRKTLAFGHYEHLTRLHWIRSLPFHSCKLPPRRTISGVPALCCFLPSLVMRSCLIQ